MPIAMVSSMQQRLEIASQLRIAKKHKDILKKAPSLTEQVVQNQEMLDPSTTSSTWYIP